MSSGVLDMLIGLTAVILALSILVQVLQEFYKFLTNSQSRFYINVLRDYIGSLADILARDPKLARYRVRSSFQILSRIPPKRLLPLSKSELGNALEETAPLWIRRVLNQLRVVGEGGEDEGGLRESPTWNSLLKKLGETPKGSTGFGTALRIAEFLQEAGHRWNRGEKSVGKIEVDPRSEAQIAVDSLTRRFRERFVPHIEYALNNFENLQTQLGYSSKRRNMRQTFVIGTLVCILCGWPIQEIHHQASLLTEEEAVVLAERATAIRTTLVHQLGTTTDATEWSEFQTKADSLLIQALKVAGTAKSDESGQILHGWIGWFGVHTDYGGFGGTLLYFLGCMATGVLIGFGAPLWNDIVKSLLGLKNFLRRTSPRGYQ